MISLVTLSNCVDPYVPPLPPRLVPNTTLWSVYIQEMPSMYKIRVQRYTAMVKTSAELPYYHYP